MRALLLLLASLKPFRNQRRSSAAEFVVHRGRRTTARGAKQVGSEKRRHEQESLAPLPLPHSLAGRRPLRGNQRLGRGSTGAGGAFRTSTTSAACGRGSRGPHPQRRNQSPHCGSPLHHRLPCGDADWREALGRLPPAPLRTARRLKTGVRLPSVETVISA